MEYFSDYLSTTTQSNRFKLTVPIKQRRISTTIAPFITHLPVVTTVRRRPQQRDEFEKITPVTKHYRTFIDYEYYDDDDIKLVGKIANQEKVIIRETGTADSNVYENIT